MLRPWTSNLVVRPDGPGSLSVKIARAIIEEIGRGRLAAGDSLPGTRDLARELDVNRKTVVLAYEELSAQGWVTTDARRGTFVSRNVSDAMPRLPAPQRVEMGAAPKGRVVEPPPLWPPTRTAGFDDGAPDPRLIPTSTIAQAYATAARAAVRQRLLSYGDPRGTEPLRRSVSTMLNLTRGLGTTPESICVTRGSQMALYAIAQCLCAPGDTVIFEALSYPPAVQAFRLAGAHVAAVNLDAEGIDLDHLERICRSTRVRAIYLTPGHQFPTTIVMTPERRLRLRALAMQFGFFIVEDDYDHEFHFDHQPLFPLASNDTTGHVIYVGSFSKILSPSLRVGYVAATPRIVERLGNWIGVIDRQGDPITELAIVELIESGQLRRHIRRVHAIFDKRRTEFAALLAAQLGDLAIFDVPSGGLAFWLRFAEGSGLGTERWSGAPQMPRILTSAHCAVASIDPEPCCARLGFASLDPQEAAEAIGRIRQALVACPGNA